MWIELPVFSGRSEMEEALQAFLDGVSLHFAVFQRHGNGKALQNPTLVGQSSLRFGGEDSLVDFHGLAVPGRLFSLVPVVNGPSSVRDCHVKEQAIVLEEGVDCLPLRGPPSGESRQSGGLGFLKDNTLGEGRVEFVTVENPPQHLDILEGGDAGLGVASPFDLRSCCGVDGWQRRQDFGAELFEHRRVLRLVFCRRRAAGVHGGDFDERKTMLVLVMCVRE
mmetsp:Transcript_25612/g.29607  ORF Transcript_25612/g.29607 Transcript_25612/m.29607 type:complete len:222 (+) Transcript_25612:2107-2772(+)